MANIDNELDIIRKAGRGEDVREAIARAIEVISNEKEYPAVTVKITANGTYSAEGNTAWNKVEVKVPEGGIDPNKIDYGGTITENGYYTPAKLYEMGYITDPDCIAVNGFNVEVNQVNAGLCEKMITENGEYDPLLDGFDGYSKVYVNVTSIERKDSYTVRFYNGNRYLGAVTVPHGANATCPAGNPTDPNFTGWNPNPANVTRDMTCYAVYGTGISGNGRTIATITDDWATIVANMNAGSRKYKPGDTKNLILNDGTNTYVLNMMLLAYNVDANANGGYAHSTWINVNPDIAMSAWGPFSRFTIKGGNKGEQYDAMHGNEAWWGNSLLRALLNGDPSKIQYDTDPGWTSDATPRPKDDLTYFNAIAAAHITIPELINAAAGMDLFNNIKPVTKHSYYNQASLPSGGTAITNQLYDQPTTDRIWIPSTRELCYPVYEDNGSGVPSMARKNDMCASGTSYSNPNAYGTWQLGLILNSEQQLYSWNDAKWVSRDCEYVGSATRSTAHRMASIRVNPTLRNNSMSIYNHFSSDTYNIENGVPAHLPVAFCL